MYTNTEKSTESYTKKGISHRKNYQKEKWALIYQATIKKYKIMRWQIQQDFIHSVYGSEEDVGMEGGSISDGLNFTCMLTTKYACLHPKRV